MCIRDSYWGYGANYDLSLKSSDYGIVKTADLILEAARHRLTISQDDINPTEKERETAKAGTTSEALSS